MCSRLFNVYLDGWYPASSDLIVTDLKQHAESSPPILRAHAGEEKEQVHRLVQVEELGA